MVLSLTHLGYNGDTLTEHWLNMLGLTAILVGIVTAIMVGMLTDRIKGNIKMLILALLTGGRITPCFEKFGLKQVSFALPSSVLPLFIITHILHTLKMIPTLSKM